MHLIRFSGWAGSQNFHNPTTDSFSMSLTPFLTWLFFFLNNQRWISSTLSSPSNSILFLTRWGLFLRGSASPQYHEVTGRVHLSMETSGCCSPSWFQVNHTHPRECQSGEGNAHFLHIYCIPGSNTHFTSLFHAAITVALKVGASSTRIFLPSFPWGALSYEKTNTDLTVGIFRSLVVCIRVHLHQGNGQRNITNRPERNIFN